MAAVIDLLQATAPVLTAALLNSVWQGLLLVAAVAVVLRAWTPLNAATRHAVWVFTLLVLLTLPVLGCWRYASDSGADNALIAKLERPDRRPAPPEPPPLPGEHTEREIQAINVDNTTAPAGPSFQMPFSWARLGTGLWFLIVCGLLFRVGRSHRRLRRLMRRATPLPETHQHHLRSIAKS